MHVESVQAQSPHISEVWKSGEWNTNSEVALVTWPKFIVT
ncbi:hypothetical protein TNCV_2971951, partial [Trichonephila clavipes]